jgi:putative peptidoglycan lipid II flippase
MLSLLTLVSRILGLIREMVKASLLGTSALSDAFSVAFLIPNLLRRLFAEGSVSVAFIPTFKEYLLEHNKARTQEFLSCMLSFLVFFVSIALVIGILAAPFLVKIFGMGEVFDETVLLTRIMFPFLAFISLAALFQGILNSVNSFTPSGIAPILLNLAVILCAYGLSPFTANPARAMAAGVLIGGLLEAAVQLPFVVKKGFSFVFAGLPKALKNSGVKKVVRLVAPAVAGMAAYQLNDLVSTALAGNLGEGVVSSLQYSLRIQELILGIFAVSIGTVLLPELTEHAKSGQWKIYNERLSAAVRIIALITIPITFFTLAQGDALIRLLFQNLRFNETSVALTRAAFTFHMPGLFFIAVNRILAPAFYAQSDSRSPSLAGIISFAVNIALAALLSIPLRGAGIALALSGASAVNTVLLLLFLKRNPHIAVGGVVRGSLRYAAKLMLFSAAATAPVYCLGPRVGALFAGQARLIAYGMPLLLMGLLFAASGIGLLLLTRDKQLAAILALLKR